MILPPFAGELNGFTLLFEAFYKVRRTIPLGMAFRIVTLKRSWKKDGPVR
jgi:hypothetical protein